MTGATNFLLATIAAAAGALGFYSALGALLHVEPILSVPATSIAYEAFTISVWPVYGLLAAIFLILELAGRRPHTLSYLLAAPVLAAIGLALYFGIAYGYVPRLPMGAAEFLFLGSVAFGSTLFALIRRLVRR